MAQAMSARETIFTAIRARRLTPAPRPGPYRPAPRADDPVALFAENAKTAAAQVRIVSHMNEVPQAVADLLRAHNLAARIHLPPAPELESLAWNEIALEHTPPGPDDSALALAPLGICETGTLVYASAANAPASWHFRAGFEIAILRAAAIVPHFEEAVARLKRAGALPHTVNLVTGPSRTGDIEQTLELGAHGPKSLAIVIVRG
jgi:L-lactate dehydrogenase complex protein LldG